MKSSIIAMSLAALLAFGVANAAAPTAAAAPAAKAQTAQQTKMGACASANKGKKGAEYKAGVSACMKAPTAAAAPAAAPATTPPTATKSKGAQQQKMSECAKANKGKKGADYKNAMSACLKK